MPRKLIIVALLTFQPLCISFTPEQVAHFISIIICKIHLQHGPSTEKYQPLWQLKRQCYQPEYNLQDIFYEAGFIASRNSVTFEVFPESLLR